MIIPHIADWHIDLLLHEYGSSYGHQKFLDWLVWTLKTEQIDVLLASRDVFDIFNPTSKIMLSAYLNLDTRANPCLCIRITACNYDYGSCLERLGQLLKSCNVQVIVSVKKDLEGKINYKKP